MSEYRSPLKEWRDEHGMSLRMLEDKTGVSKDVLNRFEKYGNTTVFALVRIADTLSVSTDWLLGRTEK